MVMFKDYFNNLGVKLRAQVQVDKSLDKIEKESAVAGEIGGSSFL